MARRSKQRKSVCVASKVARIANPAFSAHFQMRRSLARGLSHSDHFPPRKPHANFFFFNRLLERNFFSFFLFFFSPRGTEPRHRCFAHMDTHPSSFLLSRLRVVIWIVLLTLSKMAKVVWQKCVYTIRLLYNVQMHSLVCNSVVHRRKSFLRSKVSHFNTLIPQQTTKSDASIKFYATSMTW